MTDIDKEIQKRIRELALQWCDTKMLMDFMEKQLNELVELARRGK